MTITKCQASIPKQYILEEMDNYDPKARIYEDSLCMRMEARLNMLEYIALADLIGAKNIVCVENTEVEKSWKRTLRKTWNPVLKEALDTYFTDKELNMLTTIAREAGVARGKHYNADLPVCMVERNFVIFIYGKKILDILVSVSPLAIQEKGWSIRRSNAEALEGAVRQQLGTLFTKSVDNMVFHTYNDKHVVSFADKFANDRRKRLPYLYSRRRSYRNYV